ncbi:TPA: FAD-binding oxidoreductase [Legionella anisa]
MNAFLLSISFIIGLMIPTCSTAQTPDVHAQHHAQPSQGSSTQSGMGATTSSPNEHAQHHAGGSGGMGEMCKMKGWPQKQLFPTMMQEPLTLEMYENAKRLADERVNQGNQLLTAEVEKLRLATQKQDAEAMEQANEQIWRAQAMIQSGLTAQRSLAEKKNIQGTALQWLRKEMNLPAVEVQPQSNGFFGLSWFHIITMMLFALFTFSMIWMYFQKLKRVNVLMARLSGSTTEPGVSAGPAFLPTTITPPVEPIPVNAVIAPTKSNAWTGHLQVAGIFVETPTVKTFRLVDPASGKLPFNYLPGQFITVTLNLNNIPVKRSYTIASSPTLRDCCEITVKHEEKGTVSHYLHTQVHENDVLQCTGPSGRFTFTGQEAQSIVLIAGGVGITPMMSVIRYLTDRSWKGDIFFFFCCKDEENIIFAEEIEYLRKRFPNLHVFLVLDNLSEPTKNQFIQGPLTKDLLTRFVPEFITHRIHLCGPPPMMNAVKTMLDALQVPKENIIVEIFAGVLPPKTEPQLPEEAGKTAVVTFAKANKTAVLTPQKTILEASEDVGVNIEYSCRIGICGLCKTKLLKGKVTMDIEDGR